MREFQTQPKTPYWRPEPLNYEKGRQAGNAYRAFVFTATGKEYAYEATHYSKLHVPTKMVRNIPWEARVTPLQERRLRFAWRGWLRYQALVIILALYSIFFFIADETSLRTGIFKLIWAAHSSCQRALRYGCFKPIFRAYDYICGCVRSLVQPVVDAGRAVVDVVSSISLPGPGYFPRFVYDAVVPTLTAAWAPIPGFLGACLPDLWKVMYYRRQFCSDILFYTIPNNCCCAGPIWLSLIALDIFFVFVFFAGFAGHFLGERIPFYGYVFLKAATIVLPLLYISPTDRLFFWVVVLVVLAAELTLTVHFAWCIAWGFEWQHAWRTVFLNWEKWFKYQRPTSNSMYLMKFCAYYVYPYVKIYLLAMDKLCSARRFRKRDAATWFFNESLRYARLRAPNVGTTGFASRDFPQGYKTPRQRWLDAVAYTEHMRQLAEAAYWYRVGQEHAYRAVQHKVRGVWVSCARGKMSAFDARMAANHLQETVDETVPSYVWYYQAHARTPKEYRDYLRRVDDYVDWVEPEPGTIMQKRFITEHIWPNPQKRTKSGLTPELTYLDALLEQDTAVNLKYGLLFILAISSLTVYSIILAGWSSNSKYAFIGALRSAAQMISYEVAISLLLLPVALLAGSLNIAMIVHMQSITVWFLFPLFPAAILFVIAMLAETNRTPFDLPEAEAELVAGYNVDYSALPFAMFFLGEYCNMILISILYCLLFLGGWTFFGYSGPELLVFKAILAWFYFIHVRATLPRYRYDQLMNNGWKIFMPIAAGFLTFVIGALLILDALPVTTELPLLEVPGCSIEASRNTPTLFAASTSTTGSRALSHK